LVTTWCRAYGHHPFGYSVRYFSGLVATGGLISPPNPNAPDQLRQLLNQLRSQNLQESITASQELAKLGTVAVEPLIKIVRDENSSHLWWLAADALGLIGDNRAVEPLIALLKNPVSFDAMPSRKYIVYALHNLADPRAVDILIETLHERVRQEDEQDGVLKVFDESDYETIEAAAGALATIGEWRGIQAVIDRMLEGDFWHDHRIGEWGGEAAFQYLLAVLKTDNQERLRNAATLLGEFGDKRAVPELATLLDSRQPDKVRHSAAYGLAELHTAEALPHLLLALTDPDEQVRLQAAFGVSYLVMGSNYMEPDEPDMPARINQALKQLGEDRLIGILLDLIHDSRPQIGAYGVLFLKAFMPYVSQETAIDRIKPALESLPGELHTAVQEVLKRQFPSESQ
jgi:HEAT repeat protein